MGLGVRGVPGIGVVGAGGVQLLPVEQDRQLQPGGLQHQIPLLRQVLRPGGQAVAPPVPGLGVAAVLVRLQRLRPAVPVQDGGGPPGQIVHLPVRPGKQAQKGHRRRAQGGKQEDPQPQLFLFHGPHPPPLFDPSPFLRAQAGAPGKAGIPPRVRFKMGILYQFTRSAGNRQAAGANLAQTTRIWRKRHAGGRVTCGKIGSQGCAARRAERAPIVPHGG